MLSNDKINMVYRRSWIKESRVLLTYNSVTLAMVEYAIIFCHDFNRMEHRNITEHSVFEEKELTSIVKYVADLAIFIKLGNIFCSAYQLMITLKILSSGNTREPSCLIEDL